MLDLDLDLEADLGIDTVKQAELFASIRGQYNIPRREDLRLSDYNTLAKVIAFVKEAAGSTSAPAMPQPVTPEEAPSSGRRCANPCSGSNSLLSWPASKKSKPMFFRQ